MTSQSCACEMCGWSGRFVPLCKGQDFLLGDNRSTFSAVICPACGFAFLERAPEDLQRYYSKRYFLVTKGGFPALSRLRDKFVLAHEARRLAKYVPEAHSILEVGPGHGLFLNALADVYPNARVWGFDITREGRLEETLHPRIAVRYAANLIEAGFEDRQFDLIVMRHVVEHVPGLRGFMCELRRLSNQSCVLYVKVPNRQSLVARLFGPYWFGFDFPRHMYYFNAHHLTRLLRETGFAQLVAGYECDAVDWAGSLRFLCARYVSTTAGRGGRVMDMLLLVVRAGLVPIGFATRACRVSSRIWVLAMRAPMQSE